MRATITRCQLYKTFSTPGPAWKWLYDVEGLGVELRGFDRLDTAVRLAKKHGATEIAKAWKPACQRPDQGGAK